jgi:hypothetical protein
MNHCGQLCVIFKEIGHKCVYTICLKYCSYMYRYKYADDVQLWVTSDKI